MNHFLPHLEVTASREEMLPFSSKLYRNIASVALSQVCALCRWYFVSIRQKGRSKMGGITFKTDKILALPLMQGPDQLNLAPVGF